MLNFDALQSQARVLVEARLVPSQGTRFQPTGFPDLGAAEYRLPDENKTLMLVLESAQSVANRLEATLWDEAKQDIVEELQGIPYIKVENSKGEFLTNSLLEAHRLNSNYILESKDATFFNQLVKELMITPDKPLDFQKFANVLAKYDLNCLVHGVFLAKKEIAGGRYRLARALSGFIEASGVERVVSGGVKNDRITRKGEATEGGGNILYQRVEYAAREIKAFFSLDLAQIYGYGLNKEVTDLLIALAFWKIQRFLERGLRLRTACDLEMVELTVKKPHEYKLPDLDTLSEELPALVKAASPAFANPPVTVVKYEPKPKTREKGTSDKSDTDVAEE